MARTNEPKHHRLNSPEIKAAARISAFYQKIFEKHGLPSAQLVAGVTYGKLADLIAGVETPPEVPMTAEEQSFVDSLIGN